jgi:hypothetical protein
MGKLKDWKNNDETNNNKYVLNNEETIEETIEDRKEMIFQKNEKIEDISFEIKDAFINYTIEHGYPLCEYLDFDNIKNYVEYLLKNE